MPAKPLIDFIDFIDFTDHNSRGSIPTINQSIKTCVLHANSAEARMVAARH